MKSHLKVKVHAMSTEMSYIRRMELKWKEKARIARQRSNGNSLTYCEKNFWSLREHRAAMKLEARTAHLAYGFMKGRSYAQMEPICYGVYKGYGITEPRWSHIGTMVERFTKDETSPQVFMQSFHEWLEDAKKWYKDNEKRILARQIERAAFRLACLSDPALQDAIKKRHEALEILGRAATQASPKARDRSDLRLATLSCTCQSRKDDFGAPVIVVCDNCVQKAKAKQV